MTEMDLEKLRKLKEKRGSASKETNNLQGMVNVLDFSTQKAAQLNEKLQKEREIVEQGEIKLSEE